MWLSFGHEGLIPVELACLHADPELVQHPLSLVLQFVDLPEEIDVYLHLLLNDPIPDSAEVLLVKRHEMGVMHCDGVASRLVEGVIFSLSQEVSPKRSTCLAQTEEVVSVVFNEVLDLAGCA